MMPGSSSAATARSSSHSRRYRRREPTSNVDETLFGGPIPENQEVIQIVTKDFVRSIRFPKIMDPPEKAIIVPRPESQRITSESKVVSKEEMKTQRRPFLSKIEDKQMPGSSSAATARSSSHSRRYRRREPTSNVDETLFGGPIPENQEVIQIVTKDFVRSIRFPKIKDPPEKAIIVPRPESQRITSESKVVSKEEMKTQRRAYLGKIEDKRMPGSSSAATARSSSHSRRYRRREPTSNVDETLFGGPIPMPGSSSAATARSSSHSRRYRRREPTSNVDETLFGGPIPENQEVIQIVTKDFVRSIRFPKIKDPPEKAIIVPRPESQRITSESKVVSKEEMKTQRRPFLSKIEDKQMPGSSSAATARSSSHSRRYRRREPTSNVDETLFGGPIPENQEVIQIVTKDFVRSIRFPKIKDPPEKAIIVPRPESQRITSESKVVSKEEMKTQRRAYLGKIEDKRMPGSSSAATARSSSHSRRYRRREPTSNVDETLFGGPIPENQEVIQIVTKDFVRSIRFPKIKDPPEKAIIVPRPEFERITAASKVFSKEEMETQRRAYLSKTEDKQKAAEEMRRQILEADESRKKNRILTETELEARDRDQRLVERANALRMEEEEEIKMLNRLILEAQCKATLDIQIQEKKQIKAELLEEEKRLDDMMEVDRRKALETEDQIDELRKQHRMRGMQQISDQIQRRLEEKRYQEVVKDMETQQMREKQEKMNLEDLKALEKKSEEQRLLQEEIMRINAETIRAKEQRREEEKLSDMRDMEYRNKKLQQDAEYEAERRRIKKEKELKIDRLRAQQEKARDYKAEQDELRARRDQNILDRKWRIKEKELAEKKAQEKAMLKEARLEQIRHKEHLMSMEAGRQKAEFERELKAQQEGIIKQKEEEESKRQKAQRYAEAIRHQMKERELSAIAKRREVFEEAGGIIEEARQRRMRLDEIKKKKLKEFRATGIAEEYCSEVERKLRACNIDSLTDGF